MGKIGLRIGENTGLNLNKLIQQKPEEEQNNCEESYLNYDTTLQN